ncbi:MAG: hypothetical protein IJM15_03860 [Erysipelotrichaceae bacterium]|nr:hypothetical protein [Erysipelotrichaceae bacterium]
MRKSLRKELLYDFIFALITLVEWRIYWSKAVVAADYFFFPSCFYPFDVSFLLLIILIWLIERVFICFSCFDQSERYLRNQAAYLAARGSRNVNIWMNMIKTPLLQMFLFTVNRVTIILVFDPRIDKIQLIMMAAVYLVIGFANMCAVVMIYLILRDHRAFPVFTAICLVYLYTIHHIIQKFFLATGHTYLDSFIQQPGVMILLAVYVIAVNLIIIYLIGKREY